MRVAAKPSCAFAALLAVLALGALAPRAAAEDIVVGGALGWGLGARAGTRRRASVRCPP
jgi:uncharacterized iron-regulated membrane protein